MSTWSLKCKVLAIYCQTMVNWCFDCQTFTRWIKVNCYDGGNIRVWPKVPIKLISLAQTMYTRIFENFLKTE